MNPTIGSGHGRRLLLVCAYLLISSAGSAASATPSRLQPIFERALLADPARAGSALCETDFESARFKRGDGRWTVSVTLQGSNDREREQNARQLLAWVAELSEPAECGGRIGSTMELWIEPAHLRALSERAEARYVGLPHRPFPAPRVSKTGIDRSANPGQGSTVTEAFDAIRTSEFWELGYRGEDIKVGVIDISFASYAERIGTELPTRIEARDFSGNGLSGSGDAHGTACAEIIYDLAPEAEIYLASIATAANLSDAVDWLIENDVDVISHSLAWFVGGGDGTGPIHDVVRRASDAGIVWVTSSGNFRLNHWTGPFRDADADDWVELNSTGKESVSLTPITGSGRINLVLLWNRWPDSSDLSFQIDLFDGDTFRDSSEPEYQDSPFAYRELSFANGREIADPNIRIRRTRGSTDATTQLRVFRTDTRGLDPEDRVTAGSLTMPADAPDVIAVGAYSWRSLALETFSSHGPTLTGAIKPEIIGPDAISTSLSQYSTFVGTSAACPHVAGAVALLMSANIKGGLHDLRWRRDEIVRILQNEAEPLPGVSEDQQGAGRIRLILARPSESSAFFAERDAGGVLLRLEVGPGAPIPGPISIHDITGRWLGEVSGTSDRGTTEYRLDRQAYSWAAGRYFARESKTGLPASFYWPGSAR